MPRTLTMCTLIDFYCQRIAEIQASLHLQKKNNRPATGFMYLLLVASVTSGLLIVNITIVGAIIGMNRGLLDAIYNDPSKVVQFRIAQALQIFIPVVMTLFQFSIFDRWVDKSFGYGKKRRPAS